MKGRSVKALYPKPVKYSHQNWKYFCGDKKCHYYSARRRNTCMKSTMISSSL